VSVLSDVHGAFFAHKHEPTVNCRASLTYVGNSVQKLLSDLSCSQSIDGSGVTALKEHVSNSVSDSAEDNLDCACIQSLGAQTSVIETSTLASNSCSSGVTYMQNVPHYSRGINGKPSMSSSSSRNTCSSTSKVPMHSVFSVLLE